jgi:hypothetical protein
MWTVQNKIDECRQNWISHLYRKTDEKKNRNTFYNLNRKMLRLRKTLEYTELLCLEVKKEKKILRQNCFFNNYISPSSVIN